MNNLEEWGAARAVVREAWKNWFPHFETLTSGTNEKIIAFFLLDDTDIEWKLYQSVPEEVIKDFADYMDDAKIELLERIGFHTQFECIDATEHMAADMSADLSELMNRYEEKMSVRLSDLTFNMLFYSEWLELPEAALEQRYKEEVCRL